MAANITFTWQLIGNIFLFLNSDLIKNANIFFEKLFDTIILIYFFLILNV